MAEKGYIDKTECLRRGFVRGADGLYRKLTVLERYGKNGWLDFGDKRYSAMDRISAGSRSYAEKKKLPLENTARSVETVMSMMR